MLFCTTLNKLYLLNLFFTTKPIGIVVVVQMVFRICVGLPGSGLVVFEHYMFFVFKVGLAFCCGIGAVENLWICPNDFLCQVWLYVIILKTLGRNVDGFLDLFVCGVLYIYIFFVSEINWNCG